MNEEQENKMDEIIRTILSIIVILIFCGFMFFVVKYFIFMYPVMKTFGIL